MRKYIITFLICSILGTQVFGLQPNTIFNNPYVCQEEIMQYINRPEFSRIQKLIDVFPGFFTRMLKTVAYTQPFEKVDAMVICGSNYFYAVNHIHPEIGKNYIFTGGVGGGTKELFRKLNIPLDIKYISLFGMKCNKKVILNWEERLPKNPDQSISEAELLAEIFMMRGLKRLGYSITDFNIIYLSEIKRKKLNKKKINIIIENKSYSTVTNMKYTKEILDHYCLMSVVIIQNLLQELRAVGNGLKFLGNRKIYGYTPYTPRVNVINVMRAFDEILKSLKYKLFVNKKDYKSTYLDLQKYRAFSKAV